MHRGSREAKRRLVRALRDHRNRLGLSQEAMANRLGFDRRTVIRLEMGDAGPSERYMASWFATFKDDRERIEIRSYFDAMIKPRFPGFSKGTLPHEHTFFGTDTLTIAIPLKIEGRGLPVIAQEDFVASQTIAGMVSETQLGIPRCEQISVTGSIDLNRDNLVVICGPKTSSAVASVIETDPAIRFEHDERGWLLVDHEAKNTYRSPSDESASHPADLAYLSRHTRPDGQGTFILLAGIHSVGSSGAVHYLERDLPAVYSAVGDERCFSTLIACDYAPSTREVVSAQRVSPFYFHHMR